METTTNSFACTYKIEITFTIIVVILLIWYYFCIYKKGKTLSSAFCPPKQTAPPQPVTTDVVASKEEFKDDISSFKASGGSFSEDSLYQQLHG